MIAASKGWRFQLLPISEVYNKSQEAHFQQSFGCNTQKRIKSRILLPRLFGSVSFLVCFPQKRRPVHFVFKNIFRSEYLPCTCEAKNRKQKILCPKNEVNIPWDIKFFFTLLIMILLKLKTTIYTPRPSIPHSQSS